MNQVIISAIAPNKDPVLAGRHDGKRAFVRYLNQIPSDRRAELIVLDFGGVELATASFLDEGLLRLRDHLRVGRFPAYLVVANLSARVGEELEDLLARAGDALLACNLSSEGVISHSRLIGKLEPKLRETFDLVQQRGEASATELHDAAPADGIGPTAWNNRLTTLVAKSLLAEVSLGRAKKYRTLLEVS